MSKATTAADIYREAARLNEEAFEYLRDELTRLYLEPPASDAKP